MLSTEPRFSFNASWPDLELVLQTNTYVLVIIIHIFHGAIGVEGKQLGWLTQLVVSTDRPGITLIFHILPLTFQSHCINLVRRAQQVTVLAVTIDGLLFLLEHTTQNEVCQLGLYCGAQDIVALNF